MYDFTKICDTHIKLIIAADFPEIIEGWKFIDSQPGQYDQPFIVTESFSPYAAKIMSFLRHCYEQKILPVILYADKSERILALDNILFDLGQEVSEVRYLFYTVNYYLVIDLFYSKSSAYYKYSLYDVHTKHIETGDFKHDDLKKWKNRLFRGLPAYSEYKDKFSRFLYEEDKEPYKSHWDKINKSDTKIIQASYEHILLYCKDTRIIYKARHWDKLKIYRNTNFVTVK